MIQKFVDGNVELLEKVAEVMVYLEGEIPPLSGTVLRSTDNKYYAQFDPLHHAPGNATPYRPSPTYTDNPESALAENLRHHLMFWVPDKENNEHKWVPRK